MEIHKLVTIPKLQKNKLMRFQDLVEERLIKQLEKQKPKHLGMT